MNKTNTNNKEQKMIMTLPGCGHVGTIRGSSVRCGRPGRGAPHVDADAVEERTP